MMHGRIFPTLQRAPGGRFDLVPICDDVIFVTVTFDFEFSAFRSMFGL